MASVLKMFRKTLRRSLNVVRRVGKATRKTVKRASGGGVPIYAADGEYVICPEDITDRWGDLEAGHRYLDAWQTASRKEHVNTLRNLAPPAQD